MQKVSFVKNSFQDSSYQKHFHSTYSISLITKGSCNFNNENRDYTATKGEVKITNPYERHEIYYSTWEHINFVPSAYFVRLIARQISFEFKDRDICFKTIIKDVKLSMYLQTLYNLVVKKQESMDIETRIIELIEYLLDNYSQKSFTKKALHVEKNRLQKAKEYIYQNANNCEISLDEICEFIGLSKYHFLRVFKKEFGMTPYKYIQNIKINNVRKMLNYDLPLSQIALECGFYDQSHMIKTYKMFYGHTPSKLSTQPIKSNNLLY